MFCVYIFRIRSIFWNFYRLNFCSMFNVMHRLHKSIFLFCKNSGNQADSESDCTVPMNRRNTTHRRIFPIFLSRLVSSFRGAASVRRSDEGGRCACEPSALHVSAGCHLPKNPPAPPPHPPSPVRGSFERRRYTR